MIDNYIQETCATNLHILFMDPTSAQLRFTMGRSCFCDFFSTRISNFKGSR
jgi:hypothetical protein